MTTETTYRADHENPTERKRFIRQLFDSIVPTYDLLNRMLSLGSDMRWRRDLVKRIQVCPGDRVLDLCCGTGDVSLLLRKAGAQTVSLDFSSEMLKKGISKGKLGIKTVFGDACNLPFADGSFDAATIAFGVRNLPDLERFLAEAERALKPGGMLAILELVRPGSRLAGVLHSLYLKGILPVVGGILSGRPRAYRYLSGTVATFMNPSEMEDRIKKHGFHAVSHVPRTFGAATIMTCLKQ